MPFPPQFSYANEDDFIQRFIIPLLHRLGFSMTVNYHGTREFGRDLIFAEFDRFGHVRYHGLQAKYVASIGVNDAQELITDCNLAFTHPFVHPQTGTEERINTFYAVNGGSIAEGAATTFFTRLATPHGGQVRLLQGKDLIALDRWASFNRSDDVAAVLSGLLIEVRTNAQWASELAADLQEYAQNDKPFPMSRLRLVASGNYLQRPLIPTIVLVQPVELYWSLASTLNAVADSVGTPVCPRQFRIGRAD